MMQERFEARCSKIMDRKQNTCESITPAGKKAVATIVQQDGHPKEVFGCLKGEVEIVGDIQLPLVPPEDWDAVL
jgi:hypothetical protein